jgi:hypothetical protein
MLDKCILKYVRGGLIMNEIKCPHCGKAFKVDEAGFADIVKQVRDHEFENALHEQVASAVKVARLETEGSLKDAAAQKDIEISKLQGQLREKDDEAKLIEAQTKNSLQENLSKKEAELAELRAKLVAKETEKQLAVTEAVNKAEKERDELAGKLQAKDSEKQLLEVSLKDKYETELKSKDEMIAYYKDMKARLSTKMVGETLEQHCEIEFEKLRATGFKNAQFGKDNDASSGSKGDYIYREFDDEGNEVISIMFEMKNEGDETATKKKNEDFFKELDKDRAEKKCEYAVLVTLLEADNDLYNSGIVDVSHRHDKMYAVRPQFFIPIITVLRNAALNSMQYKSELALVRSQNIDITNFEGELQLFQDGFMKNVKDSSSKFQEAMDGIDSTIKKLESVKEALRLSNKHLITAGNKVENVSVKRLTKNNPTMAAKFEELK